MTPLETKRFVRRGALRFPVIRLCAANCPSAAVCYEAYLLFQLIGNVKGGPLQGGFQALKCKSNIK